MNEVVLALLLAPRPPPSLLLRSLREAGSNSCYAAVTVVLAVAAVAVAAAAIVLAAALARGCAVATGLQYNLA
jgi:hypothetical protein